MTGYSEDADANVVITMTREDYERLVVSLGFAAGKMQWQELADHLAFVNRLLDGSSIFRAYQISERSDSGSSNHAG